MDAYRELLLWRKGMALAELIYRDTYAFPSAEQFGLAVDLRRAAVAIPASIAAYYTTRGAVFLRGLTLARRRLIELENQVWIAGRLHDWPALRRAEIARRMAEIERLLHACLRSLGSEDR
jgi:four helix bundle protein